ncbi:uncharacterized protein [Antedon mediterranea]
MMSFKISCVCLLVICMGNRCMSKRYDISNLRETCSTTSQCGPHQYELGLTETEINKFAPKEAKTFPCHLNRNQQIRYYICHPCSVCEPPFTVLLECGRKHDTVCYPNHSKVQPSYIPNPSTNVSPKTILYRQRLQITAAMDIPINEDSESNNRIKWRLWMIITLGIIICVNVALVIIVRKRSRRPSKRTFRNESTVNVIPASSEQTAIGVDILTNCNISLSTTTPMTMITSTKQTSYDPFWLEIKATIGPEGGVLCDSRSSVSLIVPPGSIPETHPKQEIIVRVALKPSNFGLNQQKYLTLLGPVVECLSPGLAEFNSNVTLVVPHRAKLNPDWKFQVLHSEDKYSDPVSKFRWTVTSSNQDAKHGLHFEVDEHFFRIKTSHFTTYTCAGSCSRKAPLNLQVVVYGDYVHIDGRKQTVDLRCYVCDTIKDYSHTFRVNERNGPLCVPRPINHFFDKKTKKIELFFPEDDFGRDFPWTSETFNDSLPNSREISLKHVARCCSEAIPHYEAFTLKPKDEETQVDSLEMTLKIFANGLTEIIGPIRMITMDTGRFQPPAHYTDIVSNETLREVSRQIPRDKWKDVYRTLHDFAKFEGSANIDIENIEHNNQSEMGEMKYQVLMLWRTKAGRQATKTALTQALRSCQLNSIADDCIKLESTI